MHRMEQEIAAEQPKAEPLRVLCEFCRAPARHGAMHNQIGYFANWCDDPKCIELAMKKRITCRKRTGKNHIFYGIRLVLGIYGPTPRTVAADQK